MTSTKGKVSSSAHGVIPINYSLGMVATTPGKDIVVGYFERLERRASLDGWSEEQTIKLFKFKIENETYNFTSRIRG